MDGEGIVLAGEIKVSNEDDEEFPPSDDFQDTNENVEYCPPSHHFEGSNEDDVEFPSIGDFKSSEDDYVDCGHFLAGDCVVDDDLDISLLNEIINEDDDGPRNGDHVLNHSGATNQGDQNLLFGLLIMLCMIIVRMIFLLVMMLK